jgi:hypothetical protein
VAAAIVELLATDPDERAKEHAETRLSLEKSFSLGPWVGRVLDLYERALTEAGG